MDILKYKDYEGTAELDMARGMCRGKILFIDDLITYEAKAPTDLQREFELAVEDYIATCVTLKRDPQKPIKGLFNVRIPPALHKSALLRATLDNVSLNEIVVRSMDAYLSVRADINHNVHVTVEMPEAVQTLVASGAAPSWETLSNVRH